MKFSSQPTNELLTKINLHKVCDSRFTFSTLMPNELEYDLEIKSNGNYLLKEKFDFDLATSYSKTSKSREFIMTSKDIEHFPHNMISSYFCHVLDNDESLGNVFGKSGDPNYDKPTPDFSMVENDQRSILEFTTRRDPGSCEVAFSRKISTYSDVSNFWGATLLILVVSSDRIYSNFDVTEDMCNKLVSRYNFGKQVQDKAKTLGWSRELSEEKMDRNEKIMESMSNLDWIVVDDPLSVGPDDFKKILTSESDNRYIMDLLSESKQNNDKKMSGDDMNIANDRINEYISNVNKVSGRSENKAVVPYCAFVLKRKSLSKTKFYGSSLESKKNTEEGVLSRFWSKALYKQKSPDYIRYEDAEELVEELKSEKEQRKERIKTGIKDDRCRVTIRMSSADSIAMSDYGVGAKKFANTAEKRISDDYNRKSFSWNTDTSDIDDFINSYDHSMEELPSTDLTDRLIPFVEYMEDMKYETSDAIERRLLSRLGQTCLTLSSIFSEVNLNSRKSFSKDEWVILDSAVLPCKIAIKNTKTGNHIFYSVLFHEDDLEHSYDRPFRSLRRLESGYMSTPICSLTVHDLSIWLSLPSLFLTNDAIWRDIFEETHNDNSHAKVEIMTTVLLMMENKETTSSPTFNSRYMYMEMLKPEEWTCDPFKVLTKYPILIRSRLLLWLVKRLISNFLQMLKNRSPIRFKINENDGIQEEVGEIPFITSYLSGNPVRNISVALNISYIGMYHNVDKGEKLHGFLKIFSKIISEELKMRDADINKMKNFDHSYVGKPCELKSHEYCLNHVRNIGITLRNHWKKKGFSSSDLKLIVLNALSDVSFEELSTMKASANDENFRNSDNPSWKDYVQKSRNKALDEVISLIGDMKDPDVCVFANLNKLFDILSRRGGIVANLFKKNQPTGVREIFVLTMISRVTIKFLETVSRSLCNITDNEYLTKGKDKVSSTPEHYKKVRRTKTSEDYTMTVSDSADATTWCQRYVMPPFHVMFMEIFREWPEMVKTLSSILNLVTMKRLELPKELLDLFMLNPSTRSYDKNTNVLKDQFLGMSDKNDIVEADKMLMYNRSNFMQGIMHFTSSLMHAGHMLWISNTIKKIFEIKLIRANSINAKIITSTKVSSDDSSRMTTIISNDDSEKSKAYIKGFLLWSSCFSESSYPLFTAKQSKEKSSIGIMCMIEEFNSMWTVANTVVTPKIKWAYSSQILKVTSSTTERQNTDHGVLNDLVENGARRTTVQFAEFGCLINHYSTVGLYTLETNFYDKLVENMLETKSNITWFYYLSHSKIGTSLGFQFTKWVNLKKSAKARKVEHLSRSKMIGEPGEEGSFDLHTTLPVGFARQYFSFLEKLKIPLRNEIDDLITGEEHIMFSKSDNIRETIASIKLKTLSPSLMKAFSFASASKQHTVSSYICTMPCITIRSNETVFKASLPAILKETIRLMDDEITLDESIFPQIELYESINDAVSKLRILSSGPQRNRKFYHKITIPNLFRVSRVSLIDVINKIWFKKSVRSPTFSVNLAFRKYKEIFPWLEESFDDSFKNFNKTIAKCDKLTFSDFIRNYDTKSRTTVFQNSGTPKIGFEENLLECIRVNYGPKTNGYYIRSDDDYLKRHTIHNLMNEIESKLLRILTGPSRNKLREITSLLDNDRLDSSVRASDVLGLSSRHLSLALIMCLREFTGKGYLKDNDRDRCIEIYRLMREGLIAKYVQSQKKIDGKFVGVGKLRADIGNLRIMLSIENNKVTMLTTNSIIELNKNMSQVSKFMKEQNLKLDGLRLPVEHSVTEKGNRFILESNVPGVPVYREVLDEITVENVKFDLSINKALGLSLKFKIDGTEGETVSFYPRFIHVTDRMMNDSKACESWYESTTLSDYRDIKNLLFNSQSDPSLKSWVITTMRARMVELNMLKSGFPRIEFDAESTESVVSSMNLDIIDPVSGNFSSQYDIDFPELDDENDIVPVDIDRFGLFDTDIDALLEDPKSFSVSRVMFLRKQSFWDAFLNEARTMIRNGNIKNAGLMTKDILMCCGMKTEVETTISDFMSF
jgi:hypothetical protein